MKNELGKTIVQFEQKLGQKISIYNELFLCQSLERRWKELEIKSNEDYWIFIEKNEEEIEEFMMSLNINYTDFFRDGLSFSVLENEILMQLICGKSIGSEIRVWSAGCSTGQEVYSIAMSLSNVIKKSSKNINYRIFGTDISKKALKFSENGLYCEENILNIKLMDIKKYFMTIGNKYKIIPELMNYVSFSMYNLLDPELVNPPESIFGDFDIIFCSNLLFYYKKDQQDFIIDKLKKSLAPNGYIITGDAEKILFKDMAMVKSDTGIFKK